MKLQEVELMDLLGELNRRLMNPEVEAGQYWNWDSDIIRIQKVFDTVFHWKGINGTNSFNARKDALVKEATLLTNDQVEQALIKEAKRRGFNVDSKWKSHTNEYKYEDAADGKMWDYHQDDDQLFFGEFEVYKDGNWAEIIEDRWEVRHNTIFGWVVESNDDYVVHGGVRRISEKQAQAIAGALNGLDEG